MRPRRINRGVRPTPPYVTSERQSVNSPNMSGRMRHRRNVRWTRRDSWARGRVTVTGSSGWRNEVAGGERGVDRAIAISLGLTEL